VIPSWDQTVQQKLCCGFGAATKGMTDETKTKLFEPFYTTKNIDEGTGLGLAISYDIIQKHGGELTVNSQLGVGSEFKVVLPIE
jgi:signal transduction histidine kinase